MYASCLSLTVKSLRSRSSEADQAILFFRTMHYCNISLNTPWWGYLTSLHPTTPKLKVAALKNVAHYYGAANLCATLLVLNESQDLEHSPTQRSRRYLPIGCVQYDVEFVDLLKSDALFANNGKPNLCRYSLKHSSSRRQAFHQLNLTPPRDSANGRLNWLTWT